MKLVRLAGLSLALGAFASTGCGGKAESKGHATHAAAPTTPPPTPDTTPIEALRTPAGLVLKIEPATSPAPAGSTPAPTPTAK
jgi:hypothetical protein